VRTPRRTPDGRLRRALRAAKPWLVGWAALQAALAVAGRLVARRADVGDETSTSIRRVVAVGQVALRPTNPGLVRVRLDLAMAGGVLDLSGLPRVPGGIDVTVHAVLGGLAVQVPPGWRVWWHVRGIGGVGADGPVVRSREPAGADLRLRVRPVLGGIGIESAA
jgi:hypothetical protein